MIFEIMYPHRFDLRIFIYDFLLDFSKNPPGCLPVASWGLAEAVRQIYTNLEIKGQKLEQKLRHATEKLWKTKEKLSNTKDKLKNS